MSKISVIIPVYNCEKYIARCLDSLIDQTHRDWEAICIDDGSKDNSGKILDDHSAADSRIRVIHKENEGVSAARNDALAYAEGEYLLFVDSDDFLHPQTMEICHHFAEKDESDMVAFTYNRRYRTLQMIGHILHIPESGKIRFKRYDIGSIPSHTTDNIFQWATEYSHGEKGQDKRWLVKHCQPWRCLYKADKIKDIRFISGIIYEDFPWWGTVLTRTEKATIINLPLYYYYPNKGSYIFSAKESRKIESLKIGLAAAEAIRISDPEKKRIWEERFITPFRAKLEKKMRRQR